MYQQKISPTATAPRNPFMYYSAFKLSIYFHNNKELCKPFHSVETRATVNQIYYRKISEIILDRRNGYAYLIEIAEKMKDRIYYAGLYSAYDDTMFGKFIGGKWYIDLHPEFTPENQIVRSIKFEVRNGFVILHDVEANTLAAMTVKQ